MAVSSFIVLCQSGDDILYQSYDDLSLLLKCANCHQAYRNFLVILPPQFHEPVIVSKVSKVIGR